MPDLADLALCTEERWRADAIEACKPKRPHGMLDWRTASRDTCADPACTADIPEARRRALPGVQLCVECQARRERQGRREG